MGITEPPADIYGKLMSVSDALMFRYMELVTRVPEEEIAALRRLHPMEAKKRLARTVTAMYHGDAGAAEAEARLRPGGPDGEVPDNIDLIHLATPASSEPAWKVVVLAGHGPVELRSPAPDPAGGGRSWTAGAVSDPNQKVMVSGQSRLLQVGKRKFKRFVLEKE